MAKIYAIVFPSMCICFLLEASSTTAFVEHIVSEEVVTGMVGQRSILPCTPSVNVSVRWLYQRSENSEADEIFFNGFLMNGYRQHFEVPSAASGNYALIVKSATIANNGVYTCWEENGQGEQHLVHLTVMRIPERTPFIRSSTSTTSSTMSKPGDAATDGSEGSDTRTGVTAATIAVCVIVIAAVIIVVILFVVWRKLGFGSLCRRARQDNALVDLEEPLLQDNTWREIADLEQTVYNTRKQDQTDWTNNRFVVGVARKPQLFTTLLARLENDVQKNMVHAIVGINSADCRGELIAAPLACKLKIPYVSVSLKASSKPQADVETTTFVSTMGETVTIEVANDRGLEKKNVVIIDSFYLTGRSLKAAKELVERALGARVVETIVFTAVTTVPESSGIRAIFPHNETNQI